MRYSYWIGVAVAVLLAGFAGYRYELQQIPLRAMEKAEQGIAARAGGFNRMRHAERPTAQSRNVVRPSPDQLYSACAYDLSSGPVVFEGTAPADSYWSLSFYAHNSDNYFVVNDRDLPEASFRYVLIRDGEAAPAGVPSQQIIKSPSQRGIALQRLFIDKDEREGELDALRQTAICRVAGS